MPVVAHAEEEQVELGPPAEEGSQQGLVLVGIGERVHVLLGHRHVIEQGLARGVVVRALVIQRHLALVAEEDVQAPPVDALGESGRGQQRMGGMRRRAT